MPIITYPLNGITYDASDAETYFSTRKSGIYAEEGHFGIKVSGAMEVVIAPGLAWIANGDFKGKSIASTEPVALTIPTASGTLPRRDLIVLRFDANENRSYFAVKTGTPATVPALPAAERTSALYELGLYAIHVEAAALEITDSDVTSLLLDENYCGLMRDGVTGIPTAQIQAQAMEIIEGLIESLNSDLAGIIGATVTKDAGAGQAYCDVRFSEDGTRLLFDFHNVEGADGVSVTHSWNGNVLTVTSASGTTTIDFGAIKYYKELVRFTASGTFNPSSYPTKDGTYDVILVGGGGSGAYGSEENHSYGGEAGGIRVLSNLPLIKGISYPVTIGAGGAQAHYYPGNAVTKGKAGGATSFAGFTVMGGQGGICGTSTGSGLDATEEADGYVHNPGGTGPGNRGGDSLLAKGGTNNYSGNGTAGTLGSGGGASYARGATSDTHSGAGGDGVVIIRGWVGGR